MAMGGHTQSAVPLRTPLLLRLGTSKVLSAIRSSCPLSRRLLPPSLGAAPSAGSPSPPTCCLRRNSGLSPTRLCTCTTSSPGTVLLSSSFRSNLHPEDPTSQPQAVASPCNGVLYFRLTVTHASELRATPVFKKSLSFQLGIFLLVRPSDVKRCHLSLWTLSSASSCFSNTQSCLEKRPSQCPWGRSSCFWRPRPVNFHPLPHQKLLHSPHHIIPLSQPTLPML